MKNLIVVCCLHGTEPYGLEVVKKLPASVPFILANEKALKENKRFIDVDMNRCFPGKEAGNYEERRANELVSKLKEYNFVIDLHSSSNFCPLFGIITKPTQKKIDFARKLEIKRLVLMPESFASGKALIDFVECGVSLEIGPPNREENIIEVSNLINNFLKEKSYNPDLEIFEVFKVIKKEKEQVLIKNFQEVKSGEVIAKDETGIQLAEQDFIPVLVNEASYEGTLCLACKPFDNIYKLPETIEFMTKKEAKEKKASEAKFKVTPYEVTGEIDYERLVREFGLSKIDSKLLERIKKNTGDIHFMLRRGIFFAHRDLNFILDEYEKGNKFFLYTGRGPSGKVHLGHMFPWVFTKWLQDKFGVELLFQMTDDEKFLFKEKLSLEETNKIAYENALDVIAMGFDPAKTKIIVDTDNAGIMYREACKVAKKITFSMVKSSFGMNESNNLGEIFYTSMQAVPAFLPSVIKKKNIPCLIPHAVDQDPHFRLTRDILPKLGYYKPASIQCSFLPPLAGITGKMGTSDEELGTIFTTDSPEEVKRKINKYAFSGGQATIEEHRKLGGNPDVDVSFQYLRMFFEPDDKKLAKIEADYRSGKMLTGELKQILIDKINTFLKEHQKKREEAKKHLDKFLFKE